MSDEEIKLPSEGFVHDGLFLPHKVQYSKETNDLTDLIKISKKMQDEDSKIALQIMGNARNARRKSLEAIQASEAYDAKTLLQESMSGIKIPLIDLKGKRKSVLKIPNRYSDPTAQIDEILEEINERTEWLIEMEELGEGRKYKELIHGQIAAKLRKIRQLEKKIDEIEKFKKD